MHLRWVSTTTVGGAKKRYAQLVESYREPGKKHPRVRVLFGMGALSQQQYDNIATALAANRAHADVTVAKGPPRALKPISTLRYADVAVLLQTARVDGIDSILREALGPDLAEATEIVLALILQRCLEPGSKVEAVRWIPQTAAPELLNLSLEKLNNTRIHRVLDRLHEATPGICARLPNIYHKREGSFAALFIDGTDTWFVGHGPEAAQKSKTKEGLIRRKIGIVLMCNEHGYPLQWSVSPGNTNDSVSMRELLRHVAQLPWLHNTPVVCDRAMGKPVIMKELHDLGIRFVTCMPRSDAARLNVNVPVIPLETEQNRATQLVIDAGYVKVEDTLIVKDLGMHHLDPAIAVTEADALDGSFATEYGDALINAMALAREVTDAVRQQRYSSLARAATARGIGKAALTKYRRLLDLPQAIQDEILAGKFPGVSIATAIAVRGKTDPEEIRDGFRPFIGKSKPRRPAADDAAAPSEQPEQEQMDDEINTSSCVSLRLVAYFNPDLYKKKRENAERIRLEIETLAKEMNVRLASGKSRLSKEGVAERARAKLRTHNMLEAFDLDIQERVTDGHPHLHINLKLRAEEWARRRLFDGFSILAAHPALSHGAEALAKLYRAKICIEGDFHTIKSVVELRPVRHRTNHKVEAHVTLCVLALLLERILDRTVKQKLPSINAARALAALAPLTLNAFNGTGETLYLTTQTNEEQRRILRALGLTAIADDAALQATIRPRNFW